MGSPFTVSFSSQILFLSLFKFLPAWRCCCCLLDFQIDIEVVAICMSFLYPRLCSLWCFYIRYRWLIIRHQQHIWHAIRTEWERTDLVQEVLLFIMRWHEQEHERVMRLSISYSSEWGRCKTASECTVLQFINVIPFGCSSYGIKESYHALLHKSETATSTALSKRYVQLLGLHDKVFFSPAVFFIDSLTWYEGIF